MVTLYSSFALDMTDTSDPSRHAASKRTELDVLIELGYLLALFVFLLKIVTGPHLNFSFSNATFRTSGINIFLCFILNCWPKKNLTNTTKFAKIKLAVKRATLPGLQVLISLIPHRDILACLNGPRFLCVLIWVLVGFQVNLLLQPLTRWINDLYSQYIQSPPRTHENCNAARQSKQFLHASKQTRFPQFHAKGASGLVLIW